MKNLTKEQRYWLKRKDNQMWELMEEAEMVAKQMGKYYASSSQYIQEKISGIYDRFKTEHHLTDKEARQLLNSVKNKEDINALINKIKGMPKSAEKDRLIAELESPAYASRIRRLQEVQELIDENASMIYKQDVRRTEKLLKNVANESYYETMYDIQARTGAAFSFTALDPKKVDKLLKRKWEGSSFSDRIWSNTQYLAETVKDELMLNFLTGRTEDEASKAIMERYQVGYNQARRLVRTESAYIANEMDADAYEEAGIMHYMIVATLDLKTSDICRELDGKIFLLKDKQVGENFPPFHPWCRTTTVESEDPEELKSMKRRARDPQTGKSYFVKAGTTYKEWYNNLVDVHGEDKLKQYKKDAKKGQYAVKTNSYKSLRETIHNNWDSIINIPDGLTKKEITPILEQLGFNGNYRITTIPNSLKSIGINGESVYLRTQDIGYILSRHNNQIQEEHFSKIADVIRNYDIVVKGNVSLGSDAYKFYKIYESDDGRHYGLEVGINRIDKTEEFIVHFHYFGRKGRKADKQLENLLKSPEVVDFRPK